MVLAVVLLFVCLAYGDSARFHEPKIYTEDFSKPAADYFLCRHCGADIAPVRSITSINSPAALESHVYQLYGLNNVKVQTVKNTFNFQFKIITIKKTLCVGKGNVSYNFENYSDILYYLIFTNY